MSSVVLILGTDSNPCRLLAMTGINVAKTELEKETWIIAGFKYGTIASRTK